MRKTSTQILETVPHSIRILRRMATDSFDGTITIHHLRILNMVREGLTQSQMAQILQVSEAAVSKTVQGLFKDDYLTRAPGKDKRSHDLKLTLAGKKILTKVETRMRKQLEAKLKLLTPTEQEDLSRGLPALMKLMNHMNQDLT